MTRKQQSVTFSMLVPTIHLYMLMSLTLILGIVARQGDDVLYYFILGYVDGQLTLRKAFVL